MNTTPDTADKGLTRDGLPRQRQRFAVPVSWIADKTGYSRTGIYRMRSQGNRDASLNLPRMKRMSSAFGWSMEDQLAAAAEGRWADAFETVVTAAYAKDKNHG